MKKLLPLNRATFIGLILLTAIILPSAQATDWVAGNVGFWSAGANWNNGVPGSPGDVNGRMQNGGTANVTIGTPALNNNGSVDFRMNETAANTANIVNWNPGADFFANEFIIGNHQTGTAEFNHNSGTIRTDVGWYHIGRRGNATYTMSGLSRIQADDRISIGEGANNHVTDAYLIMNGSSSLDGQHANASNNDYFIGRHDQARGTLIMNDASSANVPRWEVGRQNQAQGTIIMNNNSSMTVEFETEMGMFDTAQATVVMNSGSTYTGAAFGINNQNNRESLTTWTQNDSSRVTANSWFELGGGQSTWTLNHNSVLDANGNLVVGMRNSSTQQASVDANDGISRMILNDNSRVKGEGGVVVMGSQTDSAGLIQVNDTARLTGNFMAVAQNGAGTLEITGGGEVTISGWIAMGQQVNGDGEGGTINMSGGTLTVGGDLQVGEKKTSTLNISDGVLTVGNNMYLARDHQTQTDSPASVVNQSGGTVVVGNFLHLEQASSTGGEGTYNLTGGTLRVNDLRMGNGVAVGDFNWTTGGTLTMKEPNVGQSGVGGGGLGGAGAGTTINVTGDLSTGNGGVLDLGDLYQNNGINFDVLNVNGDLNLSGTADVLDFWDNVNLIRPGGNSTATGEYQLISVTGTLSGQFDTIIGPEALGQFFQFYQTGPTGVPLGTTADTLRRNTGYIDYRADGAYFVFKVGGQIPEPHTTAFLFLGAALLRGMTTMKQNKALRDRYAA